MRTFPSRRTPRWARSSCAPSAASISRSPGWIRRRSPWRLWNKRIGESETTLPYNGLPRSTPEDSDGCGGAAMVGRPRIGVLYSRVRVEEKWIFAAMERTGVDYERLDDRRVYFDLDHPEPWLQFEAILERSLSYVNGLSALRVLNAWGIPTANTAGLAET